MRKKYTQEELDNFIGVSEYVVIQESDFDDITIATLNDISKQSIVFENCRFKNLAFIHFTSKGTVFIHDCEIEGSLEMNETNFSHQLSIKRVTVKNIVVSNTDFQRDFLLSQCFVLDEISLNFLDTGILLSIQKVIAKDIKVIFFELKETAVNIYQVSSLTFIISFPSISFTKKLAISEIIAKRLELKYLRNPAANTIYLTKFDVRTFRLESIHNEGLLSFNTIVPDSAPVGIFQIMNCYMGKSEFCNIRFNEFTNFEISNSQIQEIIPINVRWNFDERAYRDIEPDYRLEVFRQFKMISVKNMDKISQFQFERMEIEQYNQQLDWRKDFGDWFVLKTNRLSNYHGQDWQLPITWLLFSSFLFYTLLNFATNFDCYHIGNYLNFLLPFHSLSDVTCSNGPVLNAWAKFWDILQRLFSSYFIFQFLRAFRKYVS
ncbi:hypothetical protein JMG10_03465 [Nostoc ellipsosporum NOK]|nr:hypothetical protein [Nostoc ellipsosporum NOK]